MKISRNLLRKRCLFFSSKKFDYYQALGLGKGCTKAEIKKAFAKKAQELHPDKNPDPKAREEFSRVTEAYQTLSDDQKRKVYDEYGMSSDEQKNYESMGFGGNQGGFSDFSGFGNFWGGQQGSQGGFESFFGDFEELFGGQKSRKSNRPARGEDIVLHLELSFQESVQGAERSISFKVLDKCETCKGSKCRPGTQPTKCKTCNGKGTVNFRQGPMQIQMGCSSCGGEGSVNSSPCTTCQGQGVSY